MREQEDHREATPRSGPSRDIEASPANGDGDLPFVPVPTPESGWHQERRASPNGSPASRTAETEG